MASSSLLEARSKRSALALYWALKELLDDTQHSAHDCKDDNCPVKRARVLLGDVEGRPVVPVKLPDILDPAGYSQDHRETCNCGCRVPTEP